MLRGLQERQRRPRGQAPWEIKNAFRLNADAIVSHFLLLRISTVRF